MTNTQYWVVTQDWRVLDTSLGLLRRKGGIQYVNERQLDHDWLPLVWAKPVGYYGNPVIPANFTRPRLRMPQRGFAPDYFTFGRRGFASHRLREAFAQPDSVVQFYPIELLKGGRDVVAQDYRWMNILACHAAIDLHHSDFVMEEDEVYQTNETFRFIRSYNRMVIRDDIDPSAEIFRVSEDLTTVLASDALAERVTRAGCTGISFEDPTTYVKGGPVHRYRTATGIIEEDMHKIFPETP